MFKSLFFSGMWYYIIAVITLSWVLIREMFWVKTSGSLTVTLLIFVIALHVDCYRNRSRFANLEQMLREHVSKKDPS